MKKILIIILREYLSRVKRKLFIIVTLLAPVALVLITVLPVLINKANKEDKRIAIVDDTRDKIFQNKIPDGDGMFFTFVNVPLDEIKKNYTEKNFDGVLYLPDDSSGTIYLNRPVQYFSKKQLGVSSQAVLSSLVTEAVRKYRINKLSTDLTAEQIDQMGKAVDIESRFDDGSGEKQGYAGAASVVGYVMGFVLYMILIIYGAMVMKGVMEEKTSRIAEVMISSVKPFQLMMGKIIGIALVGLTQFFIWILMTVGMFFMIALLLGPSMADSSQVAGAAQQMDKQDMQAMVSGLAGSLSALNWPLIISCFIFYFLGGYLFYASLFAAVGSAAGEETDQSLTFIVTVPIIISIMIMVNVMDQPDSKLAVIASFIPFSAPIIMSARIPFGVPLWQLALSMLSVVGGFILSTWFAGKIYRTGILMYGKKVTLKEMMKWLRYKN